ncbi:MAG: DUF3800 domain-containing protein [Synergistaceae bacterium]|nr:DUF3800 domain-containing protein [Synergistaceae bacterium]
MTGEASTPEGRLQSPDERYRLYVDESGDHVFKHLSDPAHRFLCLLGCWFRGGDYQRFHEGLVGLKQKHIPHNPDEPVVLHREEIINCRRGFWRLRDPEARRAFDGDLLGLIAETEFRIVAVVIDKQGLLGRYGEAAAHPYHLALGFLLQRYCGFLNHVNRHGDVLAESRGGREDRLLKDSYCRVYQRGVWMTAASSFQQALTSQQLKLKPKSANISGLQLADLLGHPIRQMILMEKSLVCDPPAPFAQRLRDVVRDKFNRHLYDGRVDGYGTVLYPT